MIDKVFREQQSLGIIEKIPDLDKFIELHPECSFLAHLPVFKLDRDTTKTRVVYLSNLSGSDPNKTLSLSHNQTIYAGPPLNKKIALSLIQLRFDKYLFCYSPVKLTCEPPLHRQQATALRVACPQWP